MAHHQSPGSYVVLFFLGALFFLDFPAGAAEPASGPRLTDAAFFSLLDLSRADLAAVKTSVDASDWSAARRALAQHMRDRKSPSWTFDWRTVGKNSRHVNRVAEAALGHKFNSIGIDWQFGPTIDWAFNPTAQSDSSWPVNHEWTWQFNRHWMWKSLAEAYRETGDEKYAREFVAELRSWVHDCPVPSKADNRPRSRWRTIEAGIRASDSWPEVFFAFLPAKAFDDEAVTLMLKSFADHAQYLMQFHSGGNWLTMESNGLYHVGALFPEFRDSAAWRQAAISRLYQELDVQVYPDGVQVELSPNYHTVSLKNFLGPVNLVKLTGFEIPKDYLGKLERMFEYLLYSMQPTRNSPPLNDSSEVRIHDWMEKAVAYFPKRDDFRWALDEKTGKPPARTSCEFPYAGQFYMRSGWGPDDLWLGMDSGPFGYGHQHEDKLSILLTAYGRRLLVEGGVYTYDASVWRKYVLGSQAHNVVLVDGLEQNRRREPRSTFVVRSPLAHIWKTTPERDDVEAVYDEGYGPAASRLARHTRHVTFVKPHFFIVADHLESRDGKAHLYEALFHLDTDEAQAEGLRVTTRNAGPNLTILAVGADEVKIVKGQKSPVVQGWLPEFHQGYGAVRPIPTAIYSKRADGTATVYYVLYPTAAHAVCPLRSAAVTEKGLTLQFRDDAGKELHFAPLLGEGKP